MFQGNGNKSVLNLKYMSVNKDRFIFIEVKQLILSVGKLGLD